MSIVVDQVSKSFSGQKVLKNISFTASKGEIVGFLGPNGAGKSTTMKIIAGVLSFDAGEVKICDNSVLNNPLLTKRDIGYLPEHNPLYLNMYVREFLYFVADIYKLGKTKKQRVEELIKQLGIEKEAHKKIKALSKGYRQRVGLAQALIHNPPVLILDEPTSGLDPNQLADIRELIKEIGKEKTVLFSTHIMQEVEAVCNRVLIINQGEIVADFSNLTDLRKQTSQQIEIEVEFLNEVDELLIENIQILKSVDKRLFSIQGERDIRSELFDFAVKSGNKILSVRLKERHMEELFRELTKKELR